MVIYNALFVPENINEVIRFNSQFSTLKEITRLRILSFHR